MYQEKSKKQPVYDIVYLKSLEGFTVEEVIEEKRNVVMKFVNHQTGATTRIYSLLEFFYRFIARVLRNRGY